MPMNFPDMKSLLQAAEAWEFRKPNDKETEPEYRSALADHVAPKDFIESEEIRTGKGWDTWSDAEGKGMLGRAFFKR